MSKEELLKYLIAEIDLIMHDKDYRFENEDGTWYSRESCRDLTNEEVYEELRTELRQLADIEAKLAESEKKHLLDEVEWQNYCSFKHIEPQIKGCLDREREYEKKLAELREQITILDEENSKTFMKSVNAWRENAELKQQLVDLQSEQIKEMQEHQEAMKLADKTIKDLEAKLVLKSSFGKFNTADELYKSYTNLEKEYTKLRHQFSEKEKEIELLNLQSAIKDIQIESSEIRIKRLSDYAEPEIERIKNEQINYLSKLINQEGR